MTKFAAQKLGDLLTGPANAGRLARGAAYVVFVECDDGSWCELDAESETHARALADNWVHKLGARGASCRSINPGTGKPRVIRSFYMVFATADGTWDEPLDGPVA